MGICTLDGCENETKGKNMYCCKSHATKHQNLIRIKNGTHNFLNSGEKSSIRLRKLAKEGKHPFQHISKEGMLIRGIKSREARKREVARGSHQWMRLNPKNEYSRLLSVIDKSQIKNAYLYLCKVEGLDDVIKFGWSRDLEIRAKDHRTYSVYDLEEVRFGDSKLMAEIEYELKIILKKYWVNNSSEMVPSNLYSFVKSFILNYRSSTTRIFPYLDDNSGETPHPDN